jgi:hypothetical protein
MAIDKNKETADLIGLEKQLHDILKQNNHELVDGLETTKAMGSISTKMVAAAKKQSEISGKIESLEKKIKEHRKEFAKLAADRTGVDRTHEMAELIKTMTRETVKLSKLQATAAERALYHQNVMNKLGLSKVVEYAKELAAIWKNHPMLIVLMASLYVLKQIFDAFVNMDDAAAKFRVSMGITREMTGELEADVRKSAFEFARIGVMAENIYNAIRETAIVLGTSHAATSGMAEDVAIFATNLGVAEKISVEFLKSLGQMGGTVANAQRDMMFFSQHMAAAGGVPLNDVMSDVANATKTSYSFISRSPLAFTKATIEAKKLGTSISDTAKSADHLIRFTQSVKEEMEASVLLGEALNLQKARELAYSRDLEGLNKELLRLAKQTNFEQLDPFQQESVARALGKSASEIGSMLQADRERDNIARSTNPYVIRQRNEYEKMVNANASLAKYAAQDARTQVTRMSNQATLKAISFAWISIMQRLGEVILPGVKFALEGIAKGLNWISEKMGKMGALAAILLGTVAIWAGIKAMGGLAGVFGKFTGALGKAVGNFFGGVSRGISKMGSPKVLLGILALAALAGTMFIAGKAFQQFAGIDWKGVFIGIGALGALAAAAALAGLGIEFIGVGALALGAVAVVMLVFAGAAWVMSDAMQKLSTVKWKEIALGMFAVSSQSAFIAALGVGMLLATPGIVGFTLALIPFSLIAKRAGDSMMSVGTGLKTVVDSMERLQNLSLIGTILQIRNLAKAVTELSQVTSSLPEIQIQKLERLSVAGSNETSKANAQSDSAVINELKGLRDELQKLREDFGSGKLKASVTMDGQRLDSAFGRSVAFNGALG